MNKEEKLQEIYKKIAEEHNTTSNEVEKEIAHAIKLAFGDKASSNEDIIFTIVEKLFKK